MIEDITSNNIDSGLLLRISQGDEAAFSCLFKLYSDKVFCFLLKITHSESVSKDLLQDIFLRLWMSREKLSEVNNINAYLFRMARNHAFNELERFVKRHLELSDLHQVESNNANPLDLMASVELKEKLSEAIGKLPPKQQQIFILHKEEGRSYDQIATQLNLSPSTVHNHMHHALVNLRRHLGHIYPDLFLAVLIAGKFF